MSGEEFLKSIRFCHVTFVSINVIGIRQIKGGEQLFSVYTLASSKFIFRNNEVGEGVSGKLPVVRQA